ncbi:hypothetical protein RSA46_04675 [Pseudomonas oryzihabitans]|nr:hypothetical protein SB5_03935 [Pseudomonas psychrotolerans]KTT46059.1 hypothetical protein RSA46_04675 [Pseudomonas psychrotolerans]KTT52707.1 hypothetical protein SB11R_01605 [Pseudomonas psychrotolerans]
MSLLQLLNDDRLRPLRFILVGGLATLVHILVAGALLATFSLQPYVTNLGAFLVAFGVSYCGHRYLTFARQGSIARFFIVAIAGFALNNLLLTGLLALGLSAFLAIVVATALVPVFSYLASSLWAFR